MISSGSPEGNSGWERLSSKSRFEGAREMLRFAKDYYSEVLNTPKISPDLRDELLELQKRNYFTSEDDLNAKAARLAAMTEDKIREELSGI